MAEQTASGDTNGNVGFMRGFGERLRWLREAFAEHEGAGRHAKASWAERLWVSPAMYGRWETGRAPA